MQLGFVVASEDPCGPGLVGGRLVALREDLGDLRAPPTLELQTKSNSTYYTRGWIEGTQRKKEGRIPRSPASHMPPTLMNRRSLPWSRDSLHRR
jgi:hypothetical protein